MAAGCTKAVPPPFADDRHAPIVRKIIGCDWQ